MKKIEIFCTLGPSSLTSKFLKFANRNVSLLRLNMSHLTIQSMKKNINFINKHSSIPICIDTEGAQIRSKIKIRKKFNAGSKIILKKSGGNFNVYPENVFDQLKIKDTLEIGFEGLKSIISKKNKNKIILTCLSGGILSNNKGIHLVNRKIKMDYLTKKDLLSIEIAKRMNIKNFALSFTNNETDVENFSKLLPIERKIFKIETSSALNNFKRMIKIGKYFLIDRGDLSKNVKIENIPIAQRLIFKIAKKFKKKEITIATNFLESMIDKPYPTRAEVNDIFNALEMGASGLVLSAETAIGKYPEECVTLLKKIIKNFKNRKKIKIV